MSIPNFQKTVRFFWPTLYTLSIQYTIDFGLKQTAQNERTFRRVIIICRMHILRSYVNFFGNNSDKPEATGIKLHGDVDSGGTWHALLQTFDALRQAGAKWWRNNAFCELHLSPKQRIVSPIYWRPISVKCEHRT